MSCRKRTPHQRFISVRHEWTRKSTSRVLESPFSRPAHRVFPPWLAIPAEFARRYAMERLASLSRRRIMTRSLMQSVRCFWIQSGGSKWDALPGTRSKRTTTGTESRAILGISLIKLSERARRDLDENKKE